MAVEMDTIAWPATLIAYRFEEKRADVEFDWIGNRTTERIAGSSRVGSRLASGSRVLAAKSEVIGVWIGENGRPMRVPPAVKDGMGTPPAT